MVQTFRPIAVTAKNPQRETKSLGMCLKMQKRIYLQLLGIRPSLSSLPFLLISVWEAVCRSRPEKKVKIRGRDQVFTE